METKNPSLALNEFPHTCVAERALLNFMKQHNDNVPNYNTILAASRPLFLLYLHSYQSLVWNHVATKRLEVHGRKVVVGDFIALGELPRGKVTAPEGGPGINVIEIKSENDATVFNLCDVVLPLPGHSIEYPPSCVKFYEDFMHQHGLDPHSMKRKTKECSLPGCYRNIASRASELSWNIVKYSRRDQPLLQSFFDNSLHDTPSTDTANPDDMKLALVLKFKLKPSEYATILLRELTRMKTLSISHEMADKEDDISLLIPSDKLCATHNKKTQCGGEVG